MNVQNDDVMTVSQQIVLLLKDGKEGGRRHSRAKTLRPRPNAALQGEAQGNRE